jgi:hypothetical protein
MNVAKMRPDLFAAALAQLDAVKKPSQSTPAVAKIAAKTQRAKQVFLSLGHLGKLLQGAERTLPDDAKVIAASLDRVRRGLWLTLCSGSFPLLSEGQTIPTLEL